MERVDNVSEITRKLLFWHLQIDRYENNIKNNFISFTSSRYSLISRGNVERLEVVNKKWVRVIPVPGTAMTTVSFCQYLLFEELFVNLILYLFYSLEDNLV